MIKCHNITVLLYIFNAALVSIKNLFQKHLNPTLLNGSVVSENKFAYFFKRK